MTTQELREEAVRLSVPAMVSDFEVILNPGSAARLEAASAALELVERLEDQISVYRFHSELSLLNRRACDGPIEVERRLFDLLRRAVQVSNETEGAFDIATGALIKAWGFFRREGRARRQAAPCPRG